MIARRSFPADVERALTLTAELTPASPEVDARIARQTERFSDDVRPRPSVCRSVEIAWIHRSNQERGIDQEGLWGRALREALPFLVAERASVSRPGIAIRADRRAMMGT